MRTRSWLSVLFLCLACLVGCAGKKASADGSSADSRASGSNGTLVEDDWKTKGFPVMEKTGEESALWAADYVTWEHEDVDYDPSGEFVVESQAWIQGERIYRLCHIYTMEWKRERALLETYDVSSGLSSLTELDGEKLGVSNGFVEGMYVTEPGKFVFRIQNEQEQIDKIVYSDLGDQTQIVDVMAAGSEKGDIGELGAECMCDAEGYIYTRNWYHQELYILDREGRLLMEYKGGDVTIEDPLRMPSGELLFPIKNIEDQSSQLVWFDPEQKKTHTVSSFETYPINSVYGIQGSDVYYEAWEGVVRWNVATGDRTLVYRFSQNDRLFRTMLVLRDGGAPVLRMYGTMDGEEEDWLVTLSEEEAEPGEAIRVVSLLGTRLTTNFDAKSLVAKVSRKYRNVDFVYETYEAGGLEDYRTRILAELAAGGGPDILFVSLQDMRLLQDQGYLMDLGSVLSESSLRRVLPAVIEMGTVNDTLVGLAPAISTFSAVTLKDIWDQDTWTLDDVMDLMDTGRFTGVMCQGTMGFAPRAVVKFMTEFGLWDASLVDWEAGKCHFDSERFIRLLHTAKTYSTVPFDQETGIGTGECLMTVGGLSIEDFNEFYDRYGEGYCVIGYPDSGNFLDCDGVLVVNRKVSDEKAVSAFLEYLLREEVQDSHRNYSILKVSPEDIEYRGEGSKTKAYWKQHELRIKKDGTTTLEDYAAFLENSVPSPILAEEDLILSIVWEEAEAYMVGDKSAEDVAGIIQRRIQLYLDENR